MLKLSQKKQLIDQFLIQCLNKNKVQFQAQSLSETMLQHLQTFAINGKSLRGGLFLLAAEALNKTNYQEHEADLVRVAAALELIQSGLLIHDDIIDRDAVRRDQDSTWQFYTRTIPNPIMSIEEKKHFGYSMAICAGAIAQYLAFDLLNQLESLSPETSTLLRRSVNQEISKTYFAEMLDEQITIQAEQPSKEEVLAMYLYKTARYTTVLPLTLAAIVSQSSPETNWQLQQIGEHLGLIFQIKDDEIGAFAKPEKSNKSCASDLRSGKKTILYLTVLENLNQNDPDRQKFNQLFGQPELNEKEIESLQKIFATYARPAIQKQLNELEQTSLELIGKLTATKQTKKLLQDVLSFNLKRNL